MKLFNAFLNDESGAVTVDWVVLTAAVVGLAIAAYSTIETNANTLITAAGGAVDLAGGGVLFLLRAAYSVAADLLAAIHGAGAAKAIARPWICRPPRSSSCRP